MLNLQGQRRFLRHYGTRVKSEAGRPARTRLFATSKSKGSCQQSQGTFQKAAPSDGTGKEIAKVEAQNDHVANNSKGWSAVCQSLLDKQYATEAILQSEGFQVMQNCADLDPLLVLNNVYVLSLIVDTAGDAQHLLKTHPHILKADLLAWSGLLHSLGISIKFILHVKAPLLASCAANSCMPTIEHLMRSSNSSAKAIGVHVKRNFGLLAVPEEHLIATEVALKDLGLKAAPVNRLLNSRPEIYLKHYEQQGAYIKELEEVCNTLRAHKLDPADILPHIGPLISRPHPSIRIKEKFDALAKLGLVHDAANDVHEVGDLVRACPKVLLLSGTELQRKWSYLRVVLHGGKEELLEFPEYLLKQFTRDIAPVYAYLVQNGELHRVTGGPSGKVSLELLNKEAERLASTDDVFQDYVSQWKFDMRR